MIIKSKRIPARGGSLERVIRHVSNADDNDEVELLQGNLADLDDARDDALRFGRQYAVRHFIVNPGEPITSAQSLELCRMLGAEFNFDPDLAVIWRHSKPRASEPWADHFHFLVREVDAVSGAVMSSSHSYARQEKVSRLAEVAWSHQIVTGRHNQAVIAALRQVPGHNDTVAILEGAGVHCAKLETERFSEIDHQRTKRQGLDLPVLKSIVSDALTQSQSRLEFDDTLAEAKLRTIAGDKPGVILIKTFDGIVVGSLSRLTGLRKAELERRLKFDAGKPEAPNDNSSGDLPGREEARGGPRADPRGLDDGPAAARPDDHSIRPVDAGGGRRGGDEPSLGRFGVKNRRIYADQGAGAHRLGMILSFGCAARLGPLLDLLGIARKAAQAPDIRAMGELDDLIERETARTGPPPEFELPKALLSARRKLETAEQRLQQAEQAAETVRLEIAALPAPSLLNSVFRPQADLNRQRLMDQLNERKGEALAAEYAVTAAGQNVNRLEIEYRADRSRHIATWSRRADQAASRIRAANKARALIRHTPQLAAWGARRLLFVASRLSDPSFLASRSEERPREIWTGQTDIWGIPIPPHRLG